MKSKKIPLRKCVGCRGLFEKPGLFRIVSAAAGAVLDKTGKSSGRGAYVCRSGECVKKAQKSRGLERSLKTSAGAGEIYKKLAMEVECEVA
jgi:predicted RNA-binding protein YlxR (DUF448 family)